MTSLTATLEKVLSDTVTQFPLTRYGSVSILDKSEDREIIVAGYASPQVVDRDKHIITKEALAEDLPRFMAHPHYRNVNLLHCLEAGTKVKIGGSGIHAETFKNVEDIVEGDRVLTHKGRLMPVLQVFKHKGPETLIEIRLENGKTIRLTDEHQVLVVGKGWIKAGELSTEDVLHHLVKKGYRSWGLADEHPRNYLFKGDTSHVTENTRTAARENKARVGASGAGAQATAKARKGKRLVDVYGLEKAETWMENIAKSQLGEKSHYWKGGKPRKGYPYTFNNLLKTEIRKRDGNICVWCGRTEEDELKEFNRRLSVDHVDWDKNNLDPDNLRSLCVRCHSTRNSEERQLLVNGVSILSVSVVPFDGWVYNVEVDKDHSYAGEGIIYHNSNVTVGEVLPYWEDPTTGKRYETKVDEIGLFVVCKIRTDKYRPPIVDKVIEDIEKGEIASFSISADAPFESRRHECHNGLCFWVIDKVILYEITVCFKGDEPVWTKDGLKKIMDVQVGDFVWTHKNRWRPVIQTMTRSVDEDLVRIITEKGAISPTSEHPFRVLRYGGRNEGTHYEWAAAKDIKVGDLISYHEPQAICEACGSPVFRAKARKDVKFCSPECKALVPNRKGKTKASGDSGAITQSQKLTGRKAPGKGGIKTPEGRAIQIASVQTDEFRAKRSEIASAQWKDSEFVAKQMSARNVSQNKLEKSFESFAPNFSFVGDGKLVIGGKCPDFFDGDNKLIEVYGDYWHRGQDAQDRIDFFAEHGYETLVIWESEIKSSPELVKERVEEFSGNALVKVISIEAEPYIGIVYNLEVEEDNSYTMKEGVVHNCQTPVNQDAKFTILSKAYDEVGEYAASSFCSDGVCPITVPQASSILMNGWREIAKTQFGEAPDPAQIMVENAETGESKTGKVTQPTAAEGISAPTVPVEPAGGTNRLVSLPTVATVAKAEPRRMFRFPPLMENETAATWSEDKHPRNDEGEWSSGGGGSQRGDSSRPVGRTEGGLTEHQHGGMGGGKSSWHYDESTEDPETTERDKPWANEGEVSRAVANGQPADRGMKVRPVGGVGIYQDRPVPTSRVSHVKTGDYGEAIVAAALEHLGYGKVVKLNGKKNNFPIDAFAPESNSLIEIKGGSISNSPDAHKWRMTHDGTVTGEDLKRFSHITNNQQRTMEINAWKKAETLRRKQKAIGFIGRIVGRELKPVVATCIVNMDTKQADVFVFPAGLHQEIRWKSPEAKAAYKGTFEFDDKDYH